MAEPPMPSTATARGVGQGQVQVREMRQASSSWSWQLGDQAEHAVRVGPAHRARGRRGCRRSAGSGSRVTAAAYPLTMPLPAARRASRNSALLASV